MFILSRLNGTSRVELTAEDRVRLELRFFHQLVALVVKTIESDPILTIMQYGGKVLEDIFSHLIWQERIVPFLHRRVVLLY